MVETIGTSGEHESCGYKARVLSCRTVYLPSCNSQLPNMYRYKSSTTLSSMQDKPATGIAFRLSTDSTAQDLRSGQEHQWRARFPLPTFSSERPFFAKSGCNAAVPLVADRLRLARISACNASGSSESTVESTCARAGGILQLHKSQTHLWHLVTCAHRPEPRGVRSMQAAALLTSCIEHGI